MTEYEGTKHKGIDYGMGQTNVDKETEIRYGVISQNEVFQAWADSSEPYYDCDDCEYEQGDDGCELSCCESTSFYIDNKDYQAECGESGDIFIIKSPYYTFAPFCSPCIPGACYLMSSCEGGEKAYCFDHDWFDDEKAPYPIYRVSDDREQE